MYNQLPSQVSAHATTFDLMVTDVYAAWERYRANPSDQSNYRTDNLQEIIKQTRGE